MNSTICSREKVGQLADRALDWAVLPGFSSVGYALREPEAGVDTIVWLAGSPRAAEDAGAFWHDRRPRPKHRVPWTRESAAERAALFDLCAELCGLDGADP